MDSIESCQAIVDCFEQYEQTVDMFNKENKNWDSILHCQHICLDKINSLINFEESNLYFTALLYIREDLIRQIKTIESKRDQIIIEDLTITRIINPNHEPFPNNFAPEPKKLRIESNKPGCSQTNSLDDAIKNTLTEPRSKGLCEIAGLENVKSLLKQAIIFPIRYPQLFNGPRKPWNKALLFGPPGTGKTQLAHSIAAEVNAQFYSISSADLLSRYVGESEKLIRTLFQHCQQSGQYSVIFMDEVDSLSRTRSSDETELDRRVKNQLLTQLSGLDTNTNNKIFFLAATNCPWDLDSAFIRRFQRRIYIPLPDTQTCHQLLKLQLKESVDLTEDQWNMILAQTEGWTGSDITDLVTCASHQPLKDLESATHWVITPDNKYMPAKESNLMSHALDIHTIPPQFITVRSITFEDLIFALQSVTKTVSAENIRKFNEFNAIFGILKND